jgi:ABC-type phosphate transport system substrate-binding protein
MMNIIKNSKGKLLLCASALLLSFSSLANVAVVVNSANSAAIDEGDISRIFLGKVKAFSSGEKITLVNLEYNHAVRNEFEEKVLNKSASQVKAYWSKLMFSGKGKPPEELADDKAILAFIAANPGAIGYIAESSVDASVKVIKTY